MDNDLINSSGNGPIVRKTAADRIATFNANANSIYNKFTPFTKGGIGPSQPFIYTKLTESSFIKNLTKYDSLAFPVGSTARDIKRVGQYLVTGTGLLYVTKQLFLQNKNAFNETRIYNPLSALKATARPASLGLIDYPIRHLETSGGLLNFFKDALLSTIGFQTKDAQKPRIDGTAVGGDNGVAYSNYAGIRGGARAGLLRLGTAKSASAIFESTWVTNPSQSSTSGGFLANIGKALVNKLKSLIPSTNPLGAFGGSSSETWAYRPEYKKGKDGIYYAFLADNSGFLTVNARSSQLFYNDNAFANATAASRSTVVLASTYHKYYPRKQEDNSTRVWYADKTKVGQDSVGVADDDGYKNNIKDLHKRMVLSIDSFKNEANQFRRSAERYSEIKDSTGKQYPSYKDIPDKSGGDVQNFQLKMNNATTTLDKRGFAKTSVYGSEQGSRNREGKDEYNALNIIENGKRGQEPDELIDLYEPNQSKDLIFFYFFDIINETYIPFRATIKSVSDQHQVEWEDLSYIGRADKLFLYKGFSRDVSFAFTVYANSAKELIPMWERINYLVGLSRPSKYTATGPALSQEEAEANRLANEEYGLDLYTTTGREGKFIYPPMVLFRLGDMFVDQPCVISSIGLNVSDEANWESFRSDNYKYISSPTNTIEIPDTKTRQLPLHVDLQVNLKILEKALSLGKNAHYGKTSYDSAGKETNRWIL